MKFEFLDDVSKGLRINLNLCLVQNDVFENCGGR